MTTGAIAADRAEVAGKEATLYFGETRPGDVIAVDGAVREVAESLARLGYFEDGAPGDETLFDALSVFAHTENFEKRR